MVLYAREPGGTSPNPTLFSAAKRAHTVKRKHYAGDADRRRGEEDCDYEGGSSVTFTFFREDGTWEEVCYAFPYLTTGEGEYLVKESAQTTQDHLWDLVDAPVEFPPEKNHAQPDQETAEFFGF